MVGLGNPGNEYKTTRHNIGFMAMDTFLRSVQAPTPRQEHKALTWKMKMEEVDLIMAQPQTFMNRSGESVQSLLNFYKIPLENLVVIHDDIDQNFAQLKIQKNRGHGGHNGIRDITEKLGTMDYARLKLGVGRPPHPEMNVADYVLQKFSTEELDQLPSLFQKTFDAVESLIFDGLQKASTKFNS
ncbi:MAG: aminoacyl-tRNA hydrolase [Bdellovibrionota bacterium]